MTTKTNGWRLTDEDRGVLEDLRRAVHSLLPLARTGQDVIAVGETIDAIESILSGSGIEVSVGLDVGFCRGNESFEEGLFICFHISEDGIILSKLNTTYSSNVGSDHSSTNYAALYPDGHFNEYNIGQWMEEFDEVRLYPDAKLDVSRDHV